MPRYSTLHFCFTRVKAWPVSDSLYSLREMTSAPTKRVSLNYWVLPDHNKQSENCGLAGLGLPKRVWCDFVCVNVFGTCQCVCVHVHICVPHLKFQGLLSLKPSWSILPHLCLINHKPQLWRLRFVQTLFDFDGMQFSTMCSQTISTLNVILDLIFLLLRLDIHS